MGIHWYARSPELNEALQALEAVERRLLSAAGEAAVDAAVEEREGLFEREQAARRELEQRGQAVPAAAALGWPASVQRHAAALGTPGERQSFLDFLGWGSNYYVENLRAAGVPMDRFSYPLRSLDISAAEAQQLAAELLEYVDGVEVSGPTSLFRRADRDRASTARKAALWLWFWAGQGCTIIAGD